MQHTVFYKNTLWIIQKVKGETCCAFSTVVCVWLFFCNSLKNKMRLMTFIHSFHSSVVSASSTDTNCPLQLVLLKASEKLRYHLFAVLTYKKNKQTTTTTTLKGFNIKDTASVHAAARRHSVCGSHVGFGFLLQLWFSGKMLKLGCTACNILNFNQFHLEIKKQTAASQQCRIL